MVIRGRLVRQYRACVVDSLGLGITCVLYHCTMCTRHPDLVSFTFYAIPTFHIIITCLLSFLITIPNLLIILVIRQVSNNAKSSKKILRRR